MVTEPLATEGSQARSSYNRSYLAYHIARSIDVRDLFNLHIELSLDINGREHIPGVAVYQRKPINFLRDTVRTTAMPLLAVEILSPNQLEFTLGCCRKAAAVAFTTRSLNEIFTGASSFMLFLASIALSMLISMVR